jgi:hypothetical protein
MFSSSPRLRSLYAALLVVLAGALAVHGASAADPNREPRLTRNGMIVQVPAGFALEEEADGKVRMSDGQGRQIVLWPIPVALRSKDAVSTMVQLETEARKQAPDLVVGDVMQTPDLRSCRYRTRFTRHGTKMEAYTYLTVRSRAVLARVEGPAASFAADLPGLLATVKTAWVTPFEVATPLDPSNPPAMVARQAPDGMSFYAAPPDWAVGGGNLVTGFDHPDGTMSVFTRMLSQNTAEDSVLSYLRRIVYEVDGTNAVVIAASPDSETVASARKNNQEMEAVNFYIAYDGHAGPMKGFFSVTAIPLGFGVIFSGFARADLFDQNYPLLVSVARSSQTSGETALARQRDIYSRLAAAAAGGPPIGDPVFDAMSQARAAMPKDALATYKEYLAGVPDAAYRARIYGLPPTVDAATPADPLDSQEPFAPAAAGGTGFADPASFSVPAAAPPSAPPPVLEPGSSP